MTVLKQHHAPGMPAEVYDQVAAGAMPSQRKADGFVAHYAIVEDGGITVIEIWDSIDQHDAWFNEVVKPHLAPDTPEPSLRSCTTATPSSRTARREVRRCS